MNLLVFALALGANLVTSASIPRGGPISNDIASIRPVGVPADQPLPWIVQNKHATHDPNSFKEFVDIPELHGTADGKQGRDYEDERDNQAPCTSDNDCSDPAHCYQGVCRAIPPFSNIKSTDHADDTEEA